MSIDFQKGQKQPDGTEGKGSWLTDTLNHLKSEFLTRSLMQSAAKALSQEPSAEVCLWRNAASGGPGLLRVTKGLHPHMTAGPLAGLLHITMVLYDYGSNPSGVFQNTYFMRQFHLYNKVLNPTEAESRHRLQPVYLTYQSITAKMSPNFDPKTPHTATEIRNANAVNNDITIKP
jgi:hypothetical protein